MTARFAGLSLLSLLLLLATAGLYLRTRWRYYAVTIVGHHDTGLRMELWSWRFEAVGAGILIGYGAAHYEDPADLEAWRQDVDSRKAVEWESLPPKLTARYFTAYWLVRHRRLGFAYELRRHGSASDSRSDVSRDLLVPHWAPILLFTILPVLWARRLVRRRRQRVRRSRGLCPSCGYDLRGGHDRCPECGGPAPNMRAAVEVPAG